MQMTVNNIETYKAMEDLAHGLGFRSVFDFSKHQLRDATLQKIAFYQNQINSFEKKYGMKFNEFRTRIIDKTDPILSQFGIFEKEDDDNNWEDSIDFIEIYSQKLLRVNL